MPPGNQTPFGDKVGPNGTYTKQGGLGGALFYKVILVKANVRFTEKRFATGPKCHVWKIWNLEFAPIHNALKSHKPAAPKFLYHYEQSKLEFR